MLSVAADPVGNRVALITVCLKNDTSGLSERAPDSGLSDMCASETACGSGTLYVAGGTSGRMCGLFLPTAHTGGGANDRTLRAVLQMPPQDALNAMRSAAREGALRYGIWCDGADVLTVEHPSGDFRSVLPSIQSLTLENVGAVDWRLVRGLVHHYLTRWQDQQIEEKHLVDALVLATKSTFGPRLESARQVAVITCLVRSEADVSFTEVMHLPGGGQMTRQSRLIVSVRRTSSRLGHGTSAVGIPTTATVLRICESPSAGVARVVLPASTSLSDLISDVVQHGGGSTSAVGSEVADGSKRASTKRKAAGAAGAASARPQGFVSGFNYFSKMIREEVLHKHPELRNGGHAANNQVNKIIGAMWKDMDGEARKSYELMGSADKLRFFKELAECSAASGTTKNGAPALQTRLKLPRGVSANDLLRHSDTTLPELAAEVYENRSTKPKRPTTAYMQFVALHEAKVRQEMPSATFPEIGRHLGRLWASMSARERQPFEQLGEADKMRYHKEKRRRVTRAADDDADDDDDDYDSPSKHDEPDYTAT